MKTKEYTVKWEIQINATSKKDAVIKALAIMRDKTSTATGMSVVEFDNIVNEAEFFDFNSDRSEKIRFIKKVLDDWGATNCAELELDHSPSMNSMSDGNISEVIESFDVDGVDTIVYDDEVELEWNNYNYEELSDDIIDEIYDIMEQYEIEQLKLNKNCKY